MLSDAFFACHVERGLSSLVMLSEAAWPSRNSPNESVSHMQFRVLGPQLIFGCPTLRFFCAGWDSQVSQSERSEASPILPSKPVNSYNSPKSPQPSQSIAEINFAKVSSRYPRICHNRDSVVFQEIAVHSNPSACEDLSYRAQARYPYPSTECSDQKLKDLRTEILRNQPWPT